MSHNETDPLVWDASRLRIATKSAGVALWAWNMRNDMFSMDINAHRLWGMTPEDGVITFEELSVKIHPEDINRVRAAFNATLEMNGTFEIDFRLLDGDKIRWVAARGEGDENDTQGRSMFGIFLDVTERKLAEEDRDLLAGEMSHRVKNLFAIAVGLTQIAARGAKTPQEMATDLTQRLIALGQAHELVRPTMLNERKAARLQELLSVLLGAYDDNGTVGDRIQVFAPSIMVGEGSINTLALVIHELATNSIKYGALSKGKGRLVVDCAIDGQEIVIIWTETGGPAVAEKRGKPGFGSNLVHRSIVRQLGGTINFDWPAQGVVVTLRVNQARLGV